MVVARAGEGKVRVLDEKQTTVYKRALDMEYQLKMKASRAMLSDINKRYPCMPFPLRNLLGNGSSKFGLVECLNHGLLHAYPVLYEKEGELVAHIKATVLLLPNGSDRVTTCPLQEFSSEKTVEVRCPGGSVYWSVYTRLRELRREGVPFAFFGSAVHTDSV